MNPNTVDKYLYVRKTPTWLVRGIFFLGILTWGGVIYGYSVFIKVNPIFFVIVLPVIGFLIIYHIVSYFIDLFYKQFNLRAHERLVKKYEYLSKMGYLGHGTPPSIDIFLPICGEANSVLIRTFMAVSQLPYAGKKVYVLDDKGVDDHKLLAESLGFTYFSRAEKGHMKKSGNIKYGYERSTGDFIVVFDADFAPHADFIKELIPYMDDPRVGIVQSPQYFQMDKEVHDRSPLEYGAAYVQEDFYRVIQVARDQLGAPICCGSNAIYRRAALEAIGGTVQIDHSEDMYTGVELITKGWRVKYIPLLLAVGICPDNLHAYFHQQHRWCSGSLSLMLDGRFWRSNLSAMQKLSFVSGFMYYLSHIFTIILSFQVFFLLLFYRGNINLWDSLPFIPCILFTFVVIPSFRLTKERFGGYMARNAASYSYIHASFVAFMKKSVGWQPTNIKQANISNAYRQQLRVAALFFILYVGLIGICIGSGVINIRNVNSYSLLFWIGYTLVATIVILTSFYSVLDEAKQQQTSMDIAGGAISLFAWRLKTVGAYVVLAALALTIGMIR